ncbi:MAG: hypothetical protein C0501_17520 [Isosphaera sp.]|nr:hypothetical protein [Isosphaera sp.]
MRRVGGKAMFGGAGLGALAGGGLAAVTDGILEAGKLAAAADAFGLTGEQASRLFGVMRVGGSDIRDATEGLVTFNQRVSDALSGTGEEAQKLFAGLGVGAEEFEGLDTAARFYRLLDALRAVEDPAKRVGLLLKAVGEDTGKNLIPVLGMSADQVKKLGDAVEQSSADLAAAKEASAAYSVAVATIGGAWQRAVTAAAPVIAELAGWIADAARAASEWVKQNVEVIRVAAAVAIGVAATGIALVGLGVALGIASIALGAFTIALAAVKLAVAALGFLLTPLGLVVGLVVGGLGYLVYRAASASGALDTLGSGFRAIGDTFRQTFGGIIAAVKKGDLKLAFEILTTGLHVAWLQLVEALRGAWHQFCNYFRDAFRDAFLAVQRFGLKVAAGVQGAFLSGLMKVVEGLNVAAAVAAGKGKDPNANRVEFERRGGADLEGQVRKLDVEQGEDKKAKNALVAAYTARLGEQMDRIGAAAAAARKRGDEAEVQRLVDEHNALQKKFFEPPEAEIPGLKEVDARIKARFEKVKALNRQQMDLAEQIAAGDNWIDPKPFRDAARAVEEDGARMIKELEDIDRAERDARDKGQEERLAAIRAEREELQRALGDLVRRANTEVAPMPREVQPGGGFWERTAGQLGRAPVVERLADAARGLFQSGDYQGALGMGGRGDAAAAATKELGAKLDKSNELLAVIAQNVYAPMFT